MHVVRNATLIVFSFCLLSLLSFGQTADKQAASTSTKLPSSTSASDVPLSGVTEFSAVMVGGLLGNIDELQVYRSGNLMRTEMLDMENYMVTNLETSETFIVLPKRCMRDTHSSVNTFPFSFFKSGKKYQRTPMGTEVVDGHNCQVEEVEVIPDHPTAAKTKVKLWEATDLGGFPVKVEVMRTTGTPVTITYKDIKIGKPDPEVFKHPANCGLAKQPEADKTKPKSSASPKSKPKK